MSDRKVAVVYFAVGMGLALPAVFANGWRSGYSPTYGFLQIFGGVVGAVFLLIAWRLWVLGKRTPSAKRGSQGAGVEGGS